MHSELDPSLQARSKASRVPLVLIAHDQEWHARALETVLEPQGFAVLRAGTGAEVLSLLSSAHADLFIVDWDLPDLPGTEVCRMLRGHPDVSPGTAVVLTTAGPASREARLAALSAGAWDLLAPPLDAEELVLRVRNYATAKLEIDQVREEGLLDPPTGLYNRRGILRRAQELSANAARHRRPMACVVLAADAAAAPEPRLSAAGSVVEKLADQVKQVRRESDSVGRLGRSELMILAPDTDAPGALALARRLKTSVESAPNGPERSPIRLRVGYYAVDDVSRSHLEPGEILARATMALRRSQTEPSAEGICSFD